MPVQRRLAAILAADVAGYSRLMGEDEEGTLAALISHRTELIEPCIAEHRGRVVKTTGDGLLAEFASVVDAVKCAMAFQEGMADRNTDTPEDRCIQFRIGLNLGDVIVQDDDVYGDGVNVAARIEALCDPGEVFVSAVVHDQVEGKIEASFEDRGSHVVKNIDKPVRVYRASVKTTASPAVTAVEMLFDRPAIAVLPFENLSGDPDQEYFADGLTEDIITALSLWRSFPVIARNSTFTYKGRAVKVQEVAEELGARYVLEGSVRTGGSRIRVTAQLIDAESGHHVWAERYDRELEDIFDIQDEITQQIAAIIEPTIAKIEQNRIISKPPSDFAAWEYCLRGYALIDEATKEANTNAREMFNRAIELDLNYARAHAGLAFTYFLDRRFFGAADNEEWLELGVESARRAVALDESDSEARTMLVRSFIHSRQPDAAISEGRQAVKLNPNSAAANITLGVALSWAAARYEEGIPWIERAIRLNPLDPRHFRFVTDLALAHLGAGNFEKAIDASEEAIRRRPGFLEAHVVRISALGQLGRRGQARPPITNFEEAARDCVERHSMWPQVTKDYVLDGLRKAGVWQKSDALPLPDKPSIAVLPFENISGDPEQEYFVDGMTEDLITDLSKISSLFVIARNSSFSYKGQKTDVRSIGHELGVRHVLEGSVRRAGDRIRINAQLIDTLSGGHLWAERYDGNLSDIFDLQDEIGDKIVSALQVELSEKERGGKRSTHTPDLEAYDHFVRGRHMAHEGYFARTSYTAERATHSNLAPAVELFQRTIKLDPKFAGGYAGLSWVYSLGVRHRLSDTPEQDLEEAYQLAKMAVEIDDAFGWSHTALASANLMLGRHAEAVEAAKTAMRVQPSDADAQAYLGLCLTWIGLPEEAVPYLESALRLDPRFHARSVSWLGYAYFGLHRYDDAIKALEQGAGPTGIVIHFNLAYLAASYSLSGRSKDASATIKQLLALYPSFNASSLRNLLPYKDQADIEHVCDAARKAGLPE